MIRARSSLFCQIRTFAANPESNPTPKEVNLRVWSKSNELSPFGQKWRRSLWLSWTERQWERSRSWAWRAITASYLEMWFTRSRDHSPPCWVTWQPFLSRHATPRRSDSRWPVTSGQLAVVTDLIDELYKITRLWQSTKKLQIVLLFP